MNTNLFLDIDTQVDFMNTDGTLYVPGAEFIKQNIVSLLKCAVNTDAKVISSVDTHIVDDPEFDNFPLHCVKNSYGQQKIDGTLLDNHFVISMSHKGEIPDTNKQYIIEKNEFSLFSNPYTDVLLNKINPKKVFVFGVATDFCVKQAVLGLLERDYDVTIIIDAIKGVNDSDSKDFIDFAMMTGVELASTKDVLKGSLCVLH